MIVVALWTAVLIFGAADVYLMAERLERSAQRYRICWHCLSTL